MACTRCPSSIMRIAAGPVWVPLCTFLVGETLLKLSFHSSSPETASSEEINEKVWNKVTFMQMAGRLSKGSRSAAGEMVAGRGKRSQLRCRAALCCIVYLRNGVAVMRVGRSERRVFKDEQLVLSQRDWAGGAGGGDWFEGGQISSVNRYLGSVLQMSLELEGCKNQQSSSNPGLTKQCRRSL